MSAEEYREQLTRTTNDDEIEPDSNDDETTETDATTTALVGGSVGSVLLSVPWWCWVGLLAVAVVWISRRSRSSDSSDDNVPEEGEVEIVDQNREWTS